MLKWDSTTYLLVDLVPVDGKLGLQGGDPPGREGHNVDHIAIQIFPFDGEKIRKYLITQGVKSEEPVIRYGANGKGPSIYIKDPEGNGIELKGV